MLNSAYGKAIQSSHGRNRPYLLRARYPDILPGFYSDKRTWISCLLDGELPEEVLRDLCGRSYALAVEKLPKYVRRELAEQPAES